MSERDDTVSLSDGLADGPVEQATVHDKPTRRKNDTDPVPLPADPDDPDATAGLRYWSGVEIARGGMGRVVEATDTLLGRTVALKEALSSDREARRRFARETRITARLEHPSIVPVYDAGTTADGTPFYVMRKVSGRPLDRLVKAAPELPARLALLPHVLASAQAVAHAHERGVIHRDIKPSNILVGAHGETVVIDWGLAKVVDEPDDDGDPAAAGAPLAGDSLHTRYGTVFGTPGFMPPEQARAGEVDARSDVYALGATLHYVLAQRPPHRAPTGTAALAATASTPAAPLASTIRGVPRELATIVDTALAFDPAARYPNAGAFATELQQFLTGQLVASHRYAPGERLRRFVRRNRLAVIALALALVTVAVASYVSVDRIVAARDDALAQARAAEAARGAAADRAVDLTLSQARLLLDHNPTAAVAMVKPLAMSARWRDARAIAADARAGGVAWMLPSSALTTAIAMAPDGEHAASLGDDGVLRSYDFATRSGHAIGRLAVTGTMFYLDDDHVLVFYAAPPRAAIVDLRAPSQPRTVAVPHDLVYARRGAGGVYWADDAGGAYVLAGPDAQPRAIATPFPVQGIEPSPDGSRVAVRDATRLAVVGPGSASTVVPVGNSVAMSWSPTMDRIVTSSTVQSKLVTLTTTPPTVDDVGNTWAVFAGDRLVQRPFGVLSDPLENVLFGEAILFGVRPAAGGVGVYAETTGQFVIDDGNGAPLTIPTPAYGLGGIVSSPHSRYLITIGGRAMALWNLDDFLPRQLAPPAKMSSDLAVGGNYILHGADGAQQWIDAATGAARPAPAFQFALRAAASNGRVVVIDVRGGLWLARAGTLEAVKLAGDRRDATWLDPDTLVECTSDGAVVRRDVATNKLVTIEAGADCSSMRKAGAWVVGDSSHGEWRYDTAHGFATTRDRTDSTCGGPGGAVWVGNKQRLSLWQPDGSIEPVAAFANPIQHLLAVGDRVLVGFSDRDGGSLVDASGAVRELPDLRARFARAAGRYIVSPARDGLVITDLDANASWRAARTVRTTLLWSSEDGRTLEFGNGTGSLAWSLDIPDSPDATARWLDDLTNARWDETTQTVTW